MFVFEVIVFADVSDSLVRTVSLDVDMFLDQQMPTALQLREKKITKIPGSPPDPAWAIFLCLERICCPSYMLQQWSLALVFVRSTWSFQAVSHSST